jgi:hypothetical protein
MAERSTQGKGGLIQGTSNVYMLKLKIEIEYDFFSAGEKRWLEEMLMNQVNVVTKLFEKRGKGNMASATIVSHATK